MKKYTDNELEETLSLRKKHHYSFAKLHTITGIPATTIRNWAKKDFLGTRWDTLLTTNERRRNEIRLSEITSIEKFKFLDQNIAKVLTSIIYWCEGAKYPSSNKVDFTNSDPLLLKTFIKLLRISFPLEENKFKIKLQLHSNHNYDKIKAYWGNLLDIPIDQFMKPTITAGGKRKHHKDYLGTCTIRYSDYKIQLKLIGIYEKFGEQIGEVVPQGD